jgi:ribonuclease-3
MNKDADRVKLPGIPYRFKQSGLLEQALTHRSVGKHNYERLEFLGDAVLDFVVSARLYQIKSEHNEGDLSRLRARVVRGETLAILARKLNLGDYINLGEGELKSGGFKRESILADALEAVFGAIYLDGGFSACESVILHICDPVIASLPDAGELKDPKTRLQEWLQGRGHDLPEYALVSEMGPAHQKHFTSRCVAPGTGIQADGEGGSRQKAEQAAAMATFKLLTRVPVR